MQRLALRPRQLHLTPNTRPRTSPKLFLVPQHRRITFRNPQYQYQQQTPPYQPVRFKRPSILSSKRQLTLALYILASVAFYKWMNKNSPITIEIEIKDSAKEDDKQATSSTSASQSPGAEDELEEEEYTFIPLTWAHKLPREFYRGSDPEWQEFVKIAKDKPRHKKIQDALVQQIFSTSKKHPGVNHMIGKDMKVGKYWLDISFPDGPPQEYERWGLEIGESLTQFGMDRITPEEQFRLERALWPAAVAKALWAASKAVGGIQYRRIKQALGIEGIDPFSPEERLRLALETAEKQQNAKNHKGRSGGDINPQGALVSKKSSPTEDRPASTSGSADETKKRFPWQLQLPTPGSLTGSASEGGQSMDFPIFQIVFQTTLQKYWKPKKIEPPRGSFVVQGMVEIRGSRGQILFDVAGCYDPKQAKYVALQANKRQFKLWNQRPRGGP